ncbi:hypothetical protein HQ590_00360 [bacterium]|nr:hypothetical protein [bacterium]
MQFRSRNDARWLAPSFLIALCLMTTFFTRLVSVFAASANLRARSTFQRAVDTPGGGPLGTVKLSKKGLNQSFAVDVRNLPGDDYAVFYTSSFSTNDPVYLIAALDRGASNNNWRLEYSAKNGFAPPQLPEADVEDMAGYVIAIGQPGPDTNIVDVVLQTRIPALQTKFTTIKGKGLAVPPAIPPNPDASGKIKTIYKESKGASRLDLRMKRLAGGQTYTLWLENPSGSLLFTNIAEMVLSPSTHVATYRRDTKKGETLPLESGTVLDLAGREFRVTDAFGDIHLGGVLP